MPEAASIVRLKITLEGVEPKVMRRVEVPLGIRLDRLHLVIQAAMRWTNTHLYGFEVGDERWSEAGFGFDDDEPRPAPKTTLEDVLTATGKKTLDYIYDFGDDWFHKVKVERARTSEPGTHYPRLVEAVGRCPPEDVGGPPGYDVFPEAMADPAHPEHGMYSEWHGERADPETAPEAALRDAVAQLAESRAPSRPRTRRAKR